MSGRWHTISVLVVSFLHAAAAVAVEEGHLELNVIDAQGHALPCRVHLKSANGKAQRADNLPFWHDHFVCPGMVQMQLPVGQYTCTIERGPEYEPKSVEVSIETGEIRQLTIQLARIANLAKRGWWSGELHIHREIDDIELLMRAEDLHVAPVITWWNQRNPWKQQPPPAQSLVKFDGNRYYDVMAGEDERAGGALLYFNLPAPLEITGAKREFPSPMKFVDAAREHQGVWIDVEKPFWWDMPVWIASGKVDSIGIANNHMCRNWMYVSEAWGRPRDGSRLPSPRGNGYWSQEIYYHLLNSGLRIPPSAGSASGVLPNPVGYNRVYVHLADQFTYERWWQGLKAGRSFVTNGPLLLCKANGHLPGHVFTTDEPTTIEIEISLTSNDPISTVEIVYNGQIIKLPDIPDEKKFDLLVNQKVDRSGWLLVRAITDNQQSFQFASTAPFYLEVGDAKQHISRRSTEFFVDWVRERMRRIKVEDLRQEQEVLIHHQRALEFWRDRLKTANAD